MAEKFPKPAVFTSEKLSKNRVAIFENGEYICQLRPSEVDSWLYKATRNSAKHAEDEAHITITRIKNAIEYLHSRKKRNVAKQMEMF